MTGNLKDNIEDLLEPGDYTPAEGNNGIIMVCPGCGKVSAPRSNSQHIYDPATRSVAPSIVHNQELGGCGWHGYLTNGQFNQS